MSEPEFIHDGDTAASEESYYVSITDLLIGLLFIFIILLVFFAAQFRDQAEQIVSSAQTRAELLQKMADDLEARNVEVDLDLPHGVLRLSGEGLFEVGDREPTERGVTALTALADTMARHLPCYAYEASGAEPDGCERAVHTIDTVVLEGHTDEDQIVSTGWVRDNWDLSAARATSAYRLVLDEQPGLADLRNAAPGPAGAEALFSAAGYADQRPVAQGSDAEAKAANRRIDLRVVMAPPAPKEIAPVAADDLNWRRRNEPRTLRFGSRLKFGRGRPTDGHLGLGWSRPESWGVWSNGEDIPLILPLRETLRGSAVKLRVEGVAYVEAVSPERRVEILVGETLLDSWVFEHPQNRFVRDITLPADVTSGEDPLILTFRIQNPVSPLSLGLSGDGRMLGIGLYEVRIERP